MDVFFYLTNLTSLSYPEEALDFVAEPPSFEVVPLDLGVVPLDLEVLPLDFGVASLDLRALDDVGLDLGDVTLGVLVCFCRISPGCNLVANWVNNKHVLKYSIDIYRDNWQAAL